MSEQMAGECMRTVVVIPVRYGSTRFPGKPLALLGGVPLIEHVWRNAVKSRMADGVIVATDDKRIYNTVVAFGGECSMTSADHTSGADRIGEVARRIKADVIVNLQGDEPFVNPDVIDAVVRTMAGEDPPDISTAGVPLGNEEEYYSPDIVKVVVDIRGRALYFSRSPIPHGWDSGNMCTSRHLGLYAYSREALLRFVSLPPGNLERAESLEQLRALENGMKIMVVKVDDVESIGIDRPEDIQRAEGIMKRMGNMPEGESSAGIEEGS
jgi:3-deoxy-manno-octulosonate cytidylyltransferase (CMP-KDO synthetase)